MPWQKRTRCEHSIAYAIAATGLEQSILINKDTDFHVDEDNHWVRVERYVHGEIENMGGVGHPNAHVRLPDGNTLTVAANRDLLKNDTVNRLYKNALLRIAAQYNVQTKVIRDAVLLGFVEQSSEPDEAAIQTMLQAGSQAWQQVENASRWVEQLRGAGSE